MTTLYFQASKLLWFIYPDLHLQLFQHPYIAAAVATVSHC